MFTIFLPNGWEFLQAFSVYPSKKLKKFFEYQYFFYVCEGKNSLYGVNRYLMFRYQIYFIQLTCVYFYDNTRSPVNNYILTAFGFVVNEKQWKKGKRWADIIWDETFFFSYKKRKILIGAVLICSVVWYVLREINIV